MVDREAGLGKDRAGSSATGADQEAFAKEGEGVGVGAFFDEDNAVGGGGLVDGFLDSGIGGAGGADAPTGGTGIDDGVMGGIGVGGGGLGVGSVVCFPSVGEAVSVGILKVVGMGDKRVEGVGTAKGIKARGGGTEEKRPEEEK